MNTTELRCDLLNDLALLRAGKITPSQARARAQLARAACDTLKIEITAATLMKQRFEPVLLFDQSRTIGIAA